MIDTIKLGILISESQHENLVNIVNKDSGWKWVMFNAEAGELRFLRHKGLIQADQQSFRREIFWDIPEFYEIDNTHLTVEFSVPKYWYGHNIHLLYDYIRAIREFRQLIQKQLNLTLPEVETWQVWRADICYAWRCPTQQIAEQILDSIKKLHFPRKRPHIYGDSIMFTGTTYSLKFYLKLTEFFAHDRKALLKGDAKLEWVNYLEQKADGVLRVEATLRRKYLERKGIKTLADLNAKTTYFRNDDELKENYPEIDDNPSANTFATMCILKYMDKKTDICIQDGRLNIHSELLAKFNENYKFYAPECEVKILGETTYFAGGGFSTIIKSKTVEILSEIITKLVGEHKGMETSEQVREKLRKIYKPAKASRLLGFWLFVQKLGVKAAKNDFGHNSFYVSKRALKEAGVGLVEPVKIIDASDRFIKEFKIEAPSSYATNRFDDHRNSDNLLNLISDQEAQN
jgi:Phage replication protein CRI